MAKKDEEPYKSWKKDDPEIDQYKICPKCEGVGVADIGIGKIKCSKCKGEGTVKR
jgi:DnaJ-class molecular chaperone